MDSRDGPRSGSDPHHRILVEIQILAQIPKAYPQKNGAREGREAPAVENTEGQIERVPAELHATRRVPLCCLAQETQMGEGGIVHPIEDHELRGQVQVPDLRRSQIQNPRRRCETSRHDQSQTDVVDTATRVVKLVDITVLDHCPGQRQVADAWHVGQCIGAAFRGSHEMHGQAR